MSFDIRGHGITFEQDEGGWDIATCVCGWSGPPCPDKEIAADFWGAHLLEAAGFVIRPEAAS